MAELPESYWSLLLETILPEHWSARPMESIKERRITDSSQAQDTKQVEKIQTNPVTIANYFDESNCLCQSKGL
jgi:hypothetical protein